MQRQCIMKDLFQNAPLDLRVPAVYPTSSTPARVNGELCGNQFIIKGSSKLLGEKKCELFSRLYVSLFLILWKLVLWVWNTGLRRIIKILADLSPRASKHSGPKAPGLLQAPAPIPPLWHLALSGILVHRGGWNSLVLVWNVTQHLPTFQPIWKIHW